MSHDRPFYFFRTLWGALRHADWDAAAERGFFALVVEFFRTLLGFSAWPFFVPLDSAWRPSAIRQILSTHGIESWGWGKHGSEYVFQVKLHQATWAQYLLQQHTVPLSGQLLDESARSAYRPGPRRTLRPSTNTTPTITTGSTSRVKNAITPPAPTSSLRDPVGQINRAVDRLAKW